MKFGKVLFGVGLGVLAGLLFAPKKGSELREDIKAKSKSTYDYLTSLTREDVEAKLGETIENIKKSVDEFDPDDFKETTKEKVDEVQKKLEILAEKVKSSENFEKVKGSVVEVTGRVNQKIDEVKTMINDKAAMIDEDVIDQQIDDVEKQLDEMIEEIAKIDGIESYNASQWLIVNLYNQDTLMKGTDEREYVADLFYGTGCFDSEYSPLFLTGALRLTDGHHVTEGDGGIILYEGVAEKYGLSVGDTLEIKNGNPNDPLVKCEIAGVFEVIADDTDEQATMAKPSTFYDYEEYIFVDMDVMSEVSAPYTALSLIHISEPTRRS